MFLHQAPGHLGLMADSRGRRKKEKMNLKYHVVPAGKEMSEE